MGTEEYGLAQRLRFWAVKFKAPIAQEACDEISKLEDQVGVLLLEAEATQVDLEYQGTLIKTLRKQRDEAEEKATRIESRFNDFTSKINILAESLP